MQLQVIDKLRLINADKESYYGNDNIPISPQKKKKQRFDKNVIDMTKSEYAYFHKKDTYNHGQPTNSSHDVVYSF